MTDSPMCPACRAPEHLGSPELCMIAGVAWGVTLVSGMTMAVSRARVRELFCERHAAQIFDTARMMEETIHGQQGN